MNRRFHCLAVTAFVLMASHGAWSAEPDVDEKDLPRIPPTEPDKALATFQIKQGFRIEQPAAEPLVVSPVALSFDENGRLFVVEMRDYSERRNETPHLGRVRMLEDTDGDGRFDQSTVYVENLPWPTAVFCYAGGVFVGATPDILYCKDTNGDGIADVREVVFTGFASEYAPYQTNRLNVQAMFNSFNWGLDNRVHGATSLSGGKVHLVDNEFTREWIRKASAASPMPDSQRPDRAVQDPSQGGGQTDGHPAALPLGGQGGVIDLRGRDFSFDPRTLELRAESGGGQHGLSFNSAGQKFVCSNSSHIQTLMYDERDAARNPYYTMPRALVDIAADGPAAEVFRISPDEPWRVVRTRWRLAGLVPGPVEGGGRPSGYFTGATGITIYRGDAFPGDYRENAFVADCGSNLVHRKKLYPDESGVGLIARRPDDEQKSEFLASTDNWFRPVQMANAPDGALYIADMYREVIEHPWSLPDSIKKHVNLNSGSDRGRIYRIVPDGFRQPKLPHLSAASTKELVALLESPNGWYRDTAARLLYERQDKAALRGLEAVLRGSSSALGRMHALYAMVGMQALGETRVFEAMSDPAEIVREHAVRLTGQRPRNDGTDVQPLQGVALSTPPSQLWPRLAALADDPSPRVRYRSAFVLGGIAAPEKITALVGIVRRDAADRWIRGAVLSSLREGAPDVFVQLISDVRFSHEADGRQFILELAGVIGGQNDSQSTLKVFDDATKSGDRSVAYSAIAALGNGLQRAGNTLSHVLSPEKMNRVMTQARAVAEDRGATQAERTSAIELLALVGGRDTRDVLFSMVASPEPEAIQLAAVKVLGREADASLANGLSERWNGLTSRLRSEAMPLLLARAESTRAILAAVERGDVQRADFSVAQLQMLRSHQDEGIRRQTLKLFGEPPTAGRQEAVSASYPALKLRGDAAHGKTIYLERCASCHRLSGQGYALGPDLVTVKTSGRESLLVNILDPNRQVAPNYLNYTVETKDGQTWSGLIAGESENSVTLRGPNGVETVVLRSNIARLQSQGQSVMPEGLEAGLKLEEFADLLEYIVTARE